MPYNEYEGRHPAAMFPAAGLLAAASVWELLAGLAYHERTKFVDHRPWVSSPMSVGKFRKERIALKQQLWEVCRDKKDSANPRITNQQLAERAGLSQNAVGQYLRGETPNALLSTFGPICKMLGVSVDEYLGIEHPASSDALQAVRLERDHYKREIELYKRSLRTHRIVTLILVSILALVVISLVVDLLVPNVGWFRAATSILQEVSAYA